MTNEEKLKKLLEIAQNNGWKKIEYEIQSIKIKDYFVQLGTWSGDYHWFSLNDLVTNCEKGEVSFIEALCKAKTKGSTSSVFSDKNTHKLKGFYLDEKLRMIWTLQPTSEKLEWLFDTFKHLFDEK